jgi:hypothetical protein
LPTGIHPGTIKNTSAGSNFASISVVILAAIGEYGAVFVMPVSQGNKCGLTA